MNYVNPPENQVSADEITYTTGKCHLYAVVLADLLNLPVTLWVDSMPLDENFDIIDDLCLIHAVVVNGDKIMDVTGNNASPEHYEFGELTVLTYSPAEVILLAEEKGWPLLDRAERAHIEASIMEVHGISKGNIASNSLHCS